MENKFLPYDLAVDLNEIGFNESAIAHYNVMDCNHGIIYTYSPDFKNFKKSELIPAPTWEDAFEWFLKEKNAIVKAVSIDSHKEWYAIVENEVVYLYKDDEEIFSSYQEARYKAYEKAIEMFKS